MKINCNIEIGLKDKNKAKKALESIKVDDFDFVKSKIKNTTIVASIESDSIPSLLHTVDDYLSCLTVAIKILDKD